MIRVMSMLIFVLVQVFSVAWCTQDEAESGFVLADSYVVAQLKARHQDVFSISWDSNLERIATKIRDRNVLMGNVEDFLVVEEREKPGWDLLGKYLVQYSRFNVIIRQFADEYIVGKFSYIAMISNGQELGHVGCALYFNGNFGKVYCVYKFDS